MFSVLSSDCDGLRTSVQIQKNRENKISVHVDCYHRFSTFSAGSVWIFPTFVSDIVTLPFLLAERLRSLPVYHSNIKSSLTIICVMWGLGEEVLTYSQGILYI